VVPYGLTSHTHDLGSYPKPTQIAEALVYVGGYRLWPPA